MWCCRMTGRSRGIALVQFAEAEDARTAREALDGSIFQGRLLHILPARLPPQQPEHGPNQVGDDQVRSKDCAAWSR